LKITIKSTLDLVEYLLDQYGFAYILTANINQDCLEVKFVLFNDNCRNNLPIKIYSLFRSSLVLYANHPSTPTFLQLYRMLSVYSVIKPPKTGNCTIVEGNYKTCLYV